MEVVKTYVFTEKEFKDILQKANPLIQRKDISVTYDRIRANYRDENNEYKWVSEGDILRIFESVVGDTLTNVFKIINLGKNYVYMTAKN